MVTLVILDGLGERKSEYGNAVKAAGTPNLDKLKKEYPHTLINASGKHVGLIDGQMGNSEEGHFTIGTGRIAYSGLSQIHHEIQTGEFYKNPALVKTIKHCEKNNSRLHLMGLVSDGGVHSHNSHLYAILSLTSKSKIKEVCIHFISDGRDTPIDSSFKYAKELEEKIKGTNAKIVTLTGRVYTMDREKRYNRIELSYDAIINAKAKHNAGTIQEALEKSHKAGITDEYIEPSLINGGVKVEDGDAIINFNFRKDREREITDAITQETFTHFEPRRLKNFMYTCMNEYDETFKGVELMYKPVKATDNLAAIVSKKGLKQYHIAERTKYTHVTLYFNGGIEKPYPGEERKVYESYDDISFADRPKMRAPEITENVLEKIAENKTDLFIINISNPDMISHTGNFDAAIEAMKYVDKCAYAIALATLMAGGECIITADHGAIEEMFYPDGTPMTSHTTNKVPFIVVSERYKKAKLRSDGGLANIASTILKLLDMPTPKTMEKDMFAN